jgi:tetratricopeptide (TPR) repeat protein
MGLFDWLKGKGSQQSGLETIAPAPLNKSSSDVVDVIAPAPLNKSSSENDGFEGFYRQGLAELEAGNYQQALRFFERAIALNENQAEVWTKRAVALQYLNRIGEAIEANQKAIALIKGNQLLATNNFLSSSTQSKVEFSPSIPEPIVNLDDAEKWFEQGNSLCLEGRYQEAIASYDNALKIKPGKHDAWNNRGATLGNLGRYEEVIASYDQALKIKPDDHEAWYNRGVALFNLGRYEEALASWGNALKIKPDHHEACYNRGVALFNLGRYEEAIASWGNALKIKPDDHEAWYNRGVSLRQLGRIEEEIASYDNALTIKPDRYKYRHNRGDALRHLGRNEEAITSYDRALSLTRGKLWQAWINRSGAVAQLVRKRTLLLHSLPLAMQHPDLEEPGYQGTIACLREGLKYVERTTDPEGWGELHRSTGLAHYDHARGQKNPAYFWRKAVPCYETALEALTEDQFPTAHLETLQDLIRVLTALQDTETAQTLLRKGTDLLERLLSQKTGSAKDQFERKYRPAFNELTVALAVQRGDWPTALEIAEQDKNSLLRQGLLSNQPAQSPDYGQMQTFLQQQPHTAILYWHLSANALTTFLLTGDQVEAITSDFSQLIELETWIKTWKEDYPTDKKKTSENSTKFPQNSSKSSLIPPNPPSKATVYTQVECKLEKRKNH